jgi:methylglutaconyl-CoA hydratase
LPNNSTEVVELHLDDAALTVTFNRPEQHNAFNLKLVSRLTEVFRTVATRKDIRVVILTGSGQSFSAGADLTAITNIAHHTFDQAQIDGQALFDLMMAVDECSQPVVGRINGPAIGGGLGLVSCCDITVAVDRAKFGFSETRLGLVPAVISPFVIAKIGAGWARELFLTGERFQAEFAQKIGLIHHVVEEDQLNDMVNDRVQQLLKAAPSAQVQAKKLIKQQEDKSKAEMRAFTADLFARRWLSDEGKEGVNAFLEKRKPEWQ